MMPGGARRGPGEASINRTRPTTLVLSIIVLAASQALAAPYGSPVGSHGEPAGFVPLYLGTDRTFTPAWPDEPDNDTLNWAYVAEGAAEGPCVGPGNWYCQLTGPDGYVYSRAFVPLSALPATHDFRSGVGVAYELVQRCAGQTVASVPMWVNFTYTPDEWSGFIQAFNGAGTLSVWANALDGRGGSLGEARDLYGGDAPGGNTLLEDYALSTPSNGFTSLDDWDTRTASLRVDGPSLAQHAALLYAHTHAEHTRTGYAEAEFAAVVDGVSFDFHDLTTPIAWLNVTRLDGSPLSPSAVSGGFEWYREAIRTVYDAEDADSCPKSVAIDDTGQTHLFDFAKTAAVVEKTTDGQWTLTGQVHDHAGNSVWVLRKVGVDRVAPALTATPSAQPDGANGWYRTPVTFTLACSDATSGCTTGSYGFNALTTPAASFPVTTGAAPEGVSTLRCEARDVSGLVGSGCGEVVRHDKTAPSPLVACGPTLGASTASCGATRWVRAPAAVTVTCQDNGGSDAENGGRCWYLNHSLDGAPATSLNEVAGATVGASGDGQHNLTLAVTDHAGNVATSTHTFNIDTVAPSQPSITLENDDADHLLSVSPRWSWSAADVGGGVGEYRVSINGVHRFTTASTTLTLGGDEGNLCATVVPVDRAGNLGPASDASCVFVDRARPVADVETPERTWAYRDGQRWFTLRLNWDSVVLGNVTLKTKVTEPLGRPSSGLASHETRLGGLAWTPVEGTNVCTPGVTCNQTYALAMGRGWKTFSVHGSDVAGNVNNAETARVAVVDLLAFSSASSAGATTVPYAEAWWKAPGNVTRLEVHRGGSSGFTPSLATRQASVDPSTGSWRDTLVTPNTVYWYKAQGFATVGSVETLVWTSVDYPVLTVQPGHPAGRIQGEAPGSSIG